MTNQIRIPNSEERMNSRSEIRRPSATSDRRFVRIWSFGLLSNFVIQISSLSRAPHVGLGPVQKLIPSIPGKESVIPLGEKRVGHEIKFIHLILGGIVFGIQSAADS